MANAPEDNEDEVSEAMVASFFGSESSLSTVPSAHSELTAEDRIAHYQLKDKEDHTKKVLSSFLRFLPVEGKRVFAEFIAEIADDKTLRSLSNHLVTCVLTPSELNYP
jgi:hypothetical protein